MAIEKTYAMRKAKELATFYHQQRNGGRAKVSELANILGVPVNHVPYIASMVNGLYRTTCENEPAYTNNIEDV